MVLLSLSPLICNLLSKYVLPLLSITCQCGAGASGTLKSSESVSVQAPFLHTIVALPVLALGPMKREVVHWPSVSCLVAIGAVLVKTIGVLNVASPRLVSANAHQICTFATSWMY